MGKICYNCPDFWWFFSKELFPAFEREALENKYPYYRE